MKHRVALLALLCSVIWSSVASAQETITIKTRERGAGHIGIVTRNEIATVETKLADSKGRVLEKITLNRKLALHYRETVLARDSGAPATRLQRDFFQAQSTINGVTDPLGLLGKKVVIERKAGAYSFITNDGKLLPILGEVFLRGDLERNTDGFELERQILPTTPVKPGESWNANMASVIALLSKDRMVFDAGEATGKCTLTKVVAVTGTRQVGEIKATLKLPLRSIGPIQCGANDMLVIDIQWNGYIDGSLDSAKMTRKYSLTATGSIGSQPESITLALTASSADMRSESKESGTGKPDVVPEKIAPPEPEIPATLVAQVGHSGDVKCLAMSTNGKWLVSGSFDGTARLWDVFTGREVRVFSANNQSINGVALSGDDKFLFTGGYDKTIRVWDVATGKEVRTFDGPGFLVNSLAMSGDGKLLFSADGDKTVRLWNPDTGKVVRTFVGHTIAASALAVSSDGKMIASGGLDRTARVWDVATGKEIRSFPGHDKAVTSLALTADGKTLVTSEPAKIHLWDIAGGNEIRSFPGNKTARLALTRDGKHIVTADGDNKVRVLDFATGKEIRALAGHTKFLKSLILSRDESVIFTGSMDTTVRAWGLDTGKQLRVYSGHASRVNAVTLANDGTWLYTANDDEKVHQWDLLGGIELRPLIGHIGPVKCLALSKDGRWLVSGSEDKTARLWDTFNGTEVRRFVGHTNHVAAIALTGNGKFLVTGSSDGSARLWDALTGKELRMFKAARPFPIAAVALSRDGKLLATHSNDNAIIWDVDTGNQMKEIKARSLIHSLAFIGDDTLVAGNFAGSAQTFDLATGNEIQSFLGHRNVVGALALTTDGKSLVTGSWDSKAVQWDLASGKEVKTFAGHSNMVNSTAVSMDGKWLATGSRDNSTRIWNLKTGKELCRLMSFRDGGWAVVDADGHFDGSNGGDVNALHWSSGMKTIALKQLKKRYYDPGLLAKHLGFNRDPVRDVEVFKDVNLPPLAISKKPAASATKMNILLLNNGGGIGKVQVLVNDREYLADANAGKIAPKASQGILVVDLANAKNLQPGKLNIVTIVTWNAEGFLSSAPIDYFWTAPGIIDNRPPELYIIAGGISEYSSPSLRLTFSAKDAVDMARALTLAGNRMFGADKVHCTLLTDAPDKNAAAPTRANFVKAFAEARKARPGDVLIVFLAGHGVSLRVPDQDDDIYCYLTREAANVTDDVLRDPLQRREITLSSVELADWMKQIPAQKQVLILDTCAAGAAANKMKDHRAVGAEQMRAVDQMRDRAGFHVIMGCAADRVSYEAGAFSQGLLTYALLEGMRGAALHQDKLVNVSPLFRYAEDQVPILARNIGGIQKPLVLAPIGTSFDVGTLEDEDRKLIPVATARLQLLKPALQNADEKILDDDLALLPLLRQKLRDDYFAASRSPGANIKTTFVYVDANEMPGAIRPAGKYTVKGKNVAVVMNLRRDGETLARFEVLGSRDNLPELASRIAAAIAEHVPGKNP